MSKKRKKKAGVTSQPPGSFKQFLKEAAESLKKFSFEEELNSLTQKEKKTMWFFKPIMRKLEAGNENVTKQEVKTIEQKVKNYIRSHQQDFEEKKITCYDQLIFSCFMSALEMTIKRGYNNNEESKEVKKIKEAADNIFNCFHSSFYYSYVKVIIGIGAPDKKYYGVKVNFTESSKSTQYIAINSKLYGFYPQKSMFKVNQINRPAFRMGHLLFNDEVFEWTKVKSKDLKGFYEGKKEELDVYIQSHALKRMHERLDVLSKEAVNFVLCDSTITSEGFITYKDYLYQPIEIEKIKVGYLVADVIDDKLLFKTFLFITHNSTPEGERLKQISGLGKYDISYWHIDRLSTFINFDEKKYPGLTELFSEAGLANFSELKEKDLDFENMQATNLDGLVKYLEQGQRERMNLV